MGLGRLVRGKVVVVLMEMCIDFLRDGDSENCDGGGATRMFWPRWFWGRRY